MAKILTTKGFTASLEDIIRRAEKEIFLVSYNVKISNEFITRINQAANRNVIIRLIYGKKIDDSTFEKLKDIPNLQILYHENLHAKIYANETKVVIGSMNFSEYSEINNTEIGVLLTKTNDKEAYLDAVTHCKEILNDASLMRPLLPKSIADKHPKKSDPGINNKSGFCIRTGVPIPFNIEKPMSYDAFLIWDCYGDVYYPENFCHFSGEPSFGDTCKAKPVLAKNWNKAKKIIERNLPF